LERPFATRAGLDEVSSLGVDLYTPEADPNDSTL
jgi:hypothetical protein